jgi:phosphopantetheinyl transferase (holo-ACP synthase)
MTGATRRTPAPARSGHLEFAAPDDRPARLLLPTDEGAPEVRPRFAGIDLLDVHRLGRAATRTGPHLERRICTRTELSSLPDHPRHRLIELARIFSIKESAVKVLGGMPRGATFRDLCTAGSRSQPYIVALSGEAARRADLLDVRLLAGSQELDARLLLSWAIGVAS